MLKHRPGARNANADAPSRVPHDPALTSEEELPLLVLARGEDNLAALQEADSFLRPILKHLRCPNKATTRKVKRAARAFAIIENVFYRRAKGFAEEILHWWYQDGSGERS